MTLELARYQAYRGFFSSALGDRAVARRKDEAIAAAIQYDREHYQDEIFPRLDEFERELDALYLIYQESQHEKEALAKSGLVEVLAFGSQVLLIHYSRYQHMQKQKRYQFLLEELNAFARVPEVVQAQPNDGGPVTVFTFEDEGSWLNARIAWIITKVNAVFADIKRMLAQPSYLRGRIGDANLPRIYWVFCHFSLNEIILVLKDTPVLEKIGKLLGQHIDLDKFSDTLNRPNDILNVLSVAFFAGRLLIDVAMLIKHTYGATAGERENTTAKQRFIAELDKRCWNMANNMVWGSVNLVTNYYDKFGLPVEWAFPIVAGVLVFDVALVQILYARDKRKHMAALENIDAEMNLIRLDETDLREKQNYLKILRKEKDVLVHKWEIEKSLYNFRLMAALTLFVSFSISLMVTPPLAILACYLVGCLGVAIYASEGEYAAYLAAQKRYQYAVRAPDGVSASELIQLQKERDNAQSKLYSALVERAFAPIAIMVLVGICPTAGLATLAGYLLFKVNQAYCGEKAAPNKEVVLNQFSLFNGVPGSEVELNLLTPPTTDTLVCDVGGSPGR